MNSRCDFFFKKKFYVQPRNLNPVKISKGAPSINIEISMQEAAQR